MNKLAVRRAAQKIVARSEREPISDAELAAYRAAVEAEANAMDTALLILDQAIEKLRVMRDWYRDNLAQQTVAAECARFFTDHRRVFPCQSPYEVAKTYLERVHNQRTRDDARMARELAAKEEETRHG